MVLLALIGTRSGGAVFFFREKCGKAAEVKRDLFSEQIPKLQALHWIYFGGRDRGGGGGSIVGLWRPRASNLVVSGESRALFSHDLQKRQRAICASCSHVKVAMSDRVSGTQSHWPVLKSSGLENGHFFEVVTGTKERKMKGRKGGGRKERRGKGTKRERKGKRRENGGGKGNEGGGGRRGRGKGGGKGELCKNPCFVLDGQNARFPNSG